jgi:DNA-directed RNA polymerase sigma subunit (sigma70/sigma32)
MSQTGQAYTIHGDLVDPAITEGMDWSGRPKYEAYLSLTEDSTALEELNSESERHGLRLGEIFETLEDDDAPPTQSELKALSEEQAEILERLEDMQDRVQQLENRLDGPTYDNELTSNQPLAVAKPQL